MKRRIWLNLLVLFAAALYVFHKTKAPDSWALMGVLLFVQVILFSVLTFRAGRKSFKSFYRRALANCERMPKTLRFYEEPLNFSDSFFFLNTNLQRTL